MTADGTGSRHARVGPITRSVIVASDDPASLHTLASAFASDGYQVTSTQDGWALLECLRTVIDGRLRVPDAVVAEAALPGCSGLDLLIGLRDGGWTVPVILLASARVAADPKLGERVGRLGRAAVLAKPVDLDDLRTVLSLAQTLRPAPAR